MSPDRIDAATREAASAVLRAGPPYVRWTAVVYEVTPSGPIDVHIYARAFFVSARQKAGRQGSAMARLAARVLGTPARVSIVILLSVCEFQLFGVLPEKLDAVAEGRDDSPVRARLCTADGRRTAAGETAS